MPKARTWTFTAFVGYAADMIARVEHLGANAVQSDITSITYTVLDSAGVSTSSGAVTVSTSVFNTLQTDTRWDADATGYNFRHAVPAAGFDAAGVFQVKYVFTPASGSPFILLFEGAALAN